MNQQFIDIILQCTGATAISSQEKIQTLWSGYGAIVRCQLEGGRYPSVVVKHVQLPQPENHPRGWNTDRSHQRKLKSYEVETAWYRDWAARCGEGCKVPDCLALEQQGEEVLMVLEDLDVLGFPARLGSVGMVEMTACLRWLASFHATFLGEQPAGLWQSGTYWHLETRPDELRVLQDKPLRDAAEAIDAKLKASPFQSFVHGDAKLANFCFSENGRAVAAVDFQYVGGGCGMKDVAYFIGSCLYEEECEAHEEALLDCYFKSLREALCELGSTVDADAIEADWRGLFPVAWADFHRFVKGWSPGHWKINGYSERKAREVVAQLGAQ